MLSNKIKRMGVYIICVMSFQLFATVYGMILLLCFSNDIYCQTTDITISVVLAIQTVIAYDSVLSHTLTKIRARCYAITLDVMLSVTLVSMLTFSILL